MFQSSEKMQAARDLYKKLSEVNMEYAAYWKEYELFHWDFWVTIVLIIAPWIVWWKVRRKDSTQRLLFAGFFVIVITTWLDNVGASFGLWFYMGKVLPISPPYLPYDHCLFPVFMMLTIQYKPHVSPWIKGIILASFIAFIAEPIFIWFGLYVPVHWSVFWSWPFYVLIYWGADKISKFNGYQPVR